MISHPTNRENPLTHNDWVYKIRLVTRHEVMEECRKRHEEELVLARERFGRYCGDDHFVDCCRRLLCWMARRIGDLPEGVMHYWAKDKKPLYAPWQDIHGEVKVFAFMRFGGRQSLVLMGQLAKASLAGNISVEIRCFDSRKAFMEWVGHLDDAVAEFVGKMREEFLPT